MIRKYGGEIKMPQQNCVFCKIVDGKIPASKVYEDDSVIAFLDIMPAAKGHCLIVPKKHFEDAASTPKDTLTAMMETAKRVGKSQSQALGATGYNLLVNNGKDAGQVVFHTHLHVIPRRAHDGLVIKWKPKKYHDGELKLHQEKLASFL